MQKLWINSLKNKTFTSGKSVMASRWCQLFFFFSCPVCQFLSLYLDIYSWVGSLYLQSSVLDSIICLLLDRRIRLSAQWARGNKLRAVRSRKRGASAVSSLYSLVVGSEGSKKHEGGGRQWFSRVHQESCYIFTPTCKKTDLYSASRDTQYARLWQIIHLQQPLQWSAMG